MSEFKREERYIVLKLKHLTGADIEQIRFTLNRYGWDKALTECVVVESDWPIYEQVWDMVQCMAEGRPQQTDNISLLDLLSKIRSACGDNGLRMQDELVDHIADVTKKVEQLQNTNQQVIEALEKVCDELPLVHIYLGCGESEPLQESYDFDSLREAITNAKQREGK